MGVGGQSHASAALPPGKTPVSPCTEGCVDPRACIDGCGKNSFQRNSIPGRQGYNYVHFKRMHVDINQKTKGSEQNLGRHSHNLIC